MIQVIVDDLALIQADAVIRPTDEILNPISEVTSRLDQKAGPRFAEQRRLSATLKAGSAVVTGSGDLPAPFVLHVVIRDSDSGVRRDLVRRALQSAWERAKDWELGVIAAPPVGVGGGGLSLEEAATLMAETFPAGDDQHCPFELNIIVEQESDRELVEAIVRRMT
ncbi:MAG TPA: macro domain-containing protein [Gemmatimonadales bacterium]|nr:macro domain-containing protein [Gemmatimonadales bacterium]